jgi:hypothetical protein
MKTNAKLIIGSILIALGTIFLLSTTGILSLLNLTAGDIIGILWPAFLLSIGIKMLVDKNLSLGIVLTSLGTLFLLTYLFDIASSQCYGNGIIVIGLTMKFRKETHI